MWSRYGCDVKLEVKLIQRNNQGAKGWRLHLQNCGSRVWLRSEGKGWGWGKEGMPANCIRLCAKGK